MGTWSSAPFGNDTAKDWALHLEASQGAALVSDTIQRCLKEKSQVDAAVAAETIAAATVIAAAAYEPVRGVSADIKSWIRLQGFVPTKKLVNESRRAVKRVMKDSELRDLWEESDGLEEWSRATRKVVDKLQAVSDLPQRKPRKPGMPRSLCKLLERYDTDPSDDVRARISKKIRSLKDPNVQNRDSGYREPLSLVAARGLLEDVRYLLEQGANPSGAPHTYSGSTPFVEACAGGHLDVAEALIEAGTDVFTEVDHDAGDGFLGDAVVDQMEVRGIAPKQKGDRYCAALFAVARRGPPEAADFLCGLGAELRDTDLNGETLMHHAAEYENVPMLTYLVDAGMDPNARKGTYAETALHYAVSNNKLESARFLLENGADPNAIESVNGRKHHWRRTPLDNVNGSRQREIVALLKKHGGKSAEEITESDSV